MAQARKSPPKPAAGRKPAAKPVAKAPAAKGPVSPPPGGALRAAIWIVALAVVTGAVPLALGAQAFGYWRIPLTAPSFLPGSIVYDAPLAKPQSLVANATVQVTQYTGGGAVVATLQPGFPVQVTRYATVSGERWAQIQWTGPTKASGGTGWAKAALLHTPGASGARPIGDLAAYSPAVARAASAAGSTFAATVYFPASGYAYRTANSAQAITLGQQVVPVILVGIYANGIVAHQPNPSGGPPAIAHDLAYGNAEALIFDYNLVGGSKGLGGLLDAYHIPGFQLASSPAASTATVEGLGLFYSALTGSTMVSASDQGQIFQLLAGANPASATYATASQIGSGALVVTTSQAFQGYTTIVAGQLQPANGPTVVVTAAVSNQPTAAKAQSALVAFFKPFISSLS